MSSEEVNFDYTLPEVLNQKDNESPAKNRKVKSNGKVNKDDLQHSRNIEEAEENNNNEYDDADEYYQGVDDEENNNFQAEVQEEKMNEENVQVYPIEDAENAGMNLEEKDKKIENVPNMNNVTEISTQNRFQSKFLSTINDGSGKKDGGLSRMQMAEVAFEKVQMKMNKIFEEDEKIAKLEENKEYDKLSDVFVGQNLRLIRNLEEISQVLNIIIESSKFKNRKEDTKNKENPKKKEENSQQ